MADSRQLIAEVTIASGQTKTDAISMSNYALVAIEVPSMTGASLTFEAGQTDTATVALKDNGGANISVTLAGQGVYSVSANDFAGLPWIKIVSASAEAANRTLKVYGYKV